MSDLEKLEKATFGAGCFWGIEEAFRVFTGVAETNVGYEGGHTENPTYSQVCSGKTGHAEVVEIKFNPKQTTYEDLLSKFWEIHDPTTLNRQGPDVGSQYRSVIFFHSTEQKEIAQDSKLDIQKKFEKEIVTEIVSAQTFWPAEEYHQKYILKGGASACHV